MKTRTKKKNQVLTAMLTIVALAAGQNALAWDGSGTIESPYLIKTTSDLDQLASEVNTGTAYSGKYFKLDADIDYSVVALVNGENYTSIGIAGNPFRGTFDGNNKTVSGIRINKGDTRDQALFGYIGSGTVKDVTLLDAVITGSQCVGGIAGFNGGTVQNCLVLGATISASNEASRAGAIVGENHGTLSGNYYNGIVNSSNSGVGIGYEDANKSPHDSDGAVPGIALYNDDSSLDTGKKNTDAIADNTGSGKSVILYGRTLHKDGAWNTLCLPFDLTISGSVLDGADVRTLSSTNFDSSTGELTLTFTAKDALTELAAGTPYIIKWSGGNDIVNPVFTDVEVREGAANISKEYVDFICTYSSVSLTANDKTKLFLGAEDKLYYPNVDMNIGACRAYFLLKGITARDKASVRSFKLSFGEEESGIADSSLYAIRSSLSEWYTINGVKLDEEPTQRGIYINNGRKVVIRR